MSGSRTWHRVEAPGTYRGHALTASLGGEPWTTWENQDGSWALRYGGGEPLRVDDYESARELAETHRTQAPPAENPLPSSGPDNHFQVAAARARMVCRAVPSSWVTGPCGFLPDGTVDMHVLPGHGPHVHAELKRQEIPFRVLITEDSP